jgi:hypothetical protein
MREENLNRFSSFLLRSFHEIFICEAYTMSIDIDFISEAGEDMKIIGEHSSGISVTIEKVKNGYAYFAENDHGMTKSLEIAKRCAVVYSFSENYLFGHISEEMKDWKWHEAY